MGRIIIFTGKGGVGKSSVAAATAMKSAGEGVKTLLVSTDMAHNLGDIFERSLGKEPEEVMENLDAYEIDPEHVMKSDFAEIMDYITGLLAEKTSLQMQDLGILPGMEELFSLLRIAEIYESGVYERIIIDCAPTGETLALLKFPELMSWYMEKLFPIGKIGVRVLAPVSKSVFQVEMPSSRAMSDIEKLYVRLAGLQELLKDRAVSSVRIVTTPEKMVVEETKRNYMYLNLYDFNVDGLYINRILPKDLGNPFFDRWLTIQSGYVEYLKENFGALPIYEIPWYDEELKGTDNIRRIVTDVLADRDVFAIRVHNERETFTKTEEGYELSVSLPGADKKEIDMFQSPTDIVIKTGNFKRCIPLPNILRKYSVTKAKFDEERLRITFAPAAEEQE